MNRPFIWAHRGASAIAPENTMAAFRAALDSGADGIELDVHLSRDGVPVVIHDDTLERTTDGQGPVDSLTARELRRLDAGRWFGPAFREERIPMLADVLPLVSGRARLNIEVKDAGAGLAVLELLREHAGDDAVVSSFDRRLLRRLRGAEPGLRLAVLADGGDWHRCLRLAREVAATAFHPRADLVSRPMVNGFSRLGLPVHAWTVDAPHEVRSLVRAGIAGLFTNDPARVGAVLNPGRLPA